MPDQPELSPEQVFILQVTKVGGLHSLSTGCMTSVSTSMQCMSSGTQLNSGHTPCYRLHTRGVCWLGIVSWRVLGSIVESSTVLTQ